MSEQTHICTCSAKQYDPTHTTTLRNVFAKNMQRRFNELKKVVVEAVVTQDCFGLRSPLVTQQMVPPGYKAFDFMRDPAKVEAFMKWLQQQVDRGILTIGEFEQIGSAINEAWVNRYVLDSYKRGLLRARYEMIKAGLDVPQLDEITLAWTMGLPMHLDRLGLLFTRVFSELQGITNSMESLIAQILTQGMIDGDGPAEIARKLVAAIDGSGAGTLAITDRFGRFIPAERRAMLLARTELIRAFHLAAIQEYRNWGVEGVFVMAEWQTAGDDRVCEKCNAMQGKVFTLDEIEPLIPYHPLCRCIALPYFEKV